jgi:hypothetical protein
LPRTQPERRRDQLEQIDRDRIGDDHLVRVRPDQARDLAAEALRQVDPAVLVPAGDQILAPLPTHHVVEHARGRFGQRPERIAVEIDQAVRQRETVPPGRQRIGGVQRLAGGAGQREHRLITMRSAAHGGKPLLDHLAKLLGGGKAGARSGTASNLSEAGPIYQGLMSGLNSEPARMPVGPREGRRLQPGVEADVLCPVHVVVAEQRALQPPGGVDQAASEQRDELVGGQLGLPQDIGKGGPRNVSTAVVGDGDAAARIKPVHQKMVTARAALDEAACTFERRITFLALSDGSRRVIRQR